MRMILIYNIVMMEKNTTLNQKNNKHIKNYVRGLTEDLDCMAEKMRKNNLDVEAYQQWFALITSALDLIKTKTIYKTMRIVFNCQIIVFELKTIYKTIRIVFKLKNNLCPKRGSGVTGVGGGSWHS